jgi:hypothetical protein
MQIFAFFAILAYDNIVLNFNIIDTLRNYLILWA